MMRLSALFLLSMLAGWVNAPAARASELRGGNEVDNGGDPLRFIFVSGQQQAAQLLADLIPDQLEADLPPNVRGFIAANHQALAVDLKASRLIWQTTEQATCALTTTTPHADIRLSFDNCRPTIFSADLAGRLLLHESVHHLGIADEDLADAVAIGVYDALRRPYVSGDLGFRLDAASGLCRKSDGEPGFNPNFFGECGDLRGAPLAGLALAGIILRGANLQGVDLTNADLSRAILDDARMMGVTLRRTRFDYAQLARADLAAARIEQASFTGADLESSNMSYATVDHASLQAVNLAHALATGSTWQQTDLSWANLLGADFDGVSNLDVVLKGARVDGMTRWPLSIGEVLQLGGVRARDAGFRYQNGLCLDQAGNAGWNDRFIGACGFLREEDLAHAPLRFADLGGADLRLASLAGSDLADANLEGASLVGADLSKAQLTRATMRGSTLDGARLDAASLRFADLSGASLRQGRLSGADLGLAILAGADLRGANLSGADLSGAVLDRAQLTNAGYDGATSLPFDDDQAASRGMIFIESH
jgi:uncharacterized protein YjbI with pentapeptide repeats